MLTTHEEVKHHANWIWALATAIGPSSERGVAIVVALALLCGKVGEPWNPQEGKGDSYRDYLSRGASLAATSTS
jgi:hypothetical protein